MTKTEALALLAKHGYTEVDGVWHHPKGQDTMALVETNGVYSFDCKVSKATAKAARAERGSYRRRA